MILAAEVIRELEARPRTTRELLALLKIPKAEGAELGALLADLERQGRVQFGATERWRLANRKLRAIPTWRPAQIRRRKPAAPKARGQVVPRRREKILALLRDGPMRMRDLDDALGAPQGPRGTATPWALNYLAKQGLVRKPDRQGGAWSLVESTEGDT